MVSFFHLLHQSWIPVRTRSGAVRSAGVSEILTDEGADAPVAFAWGRADFDAACLELCIGLLALARPVTHRGWLGTWRDPPSRESITDALSPYGAAFRLDGDGPRFLQDFETLDGEASPVSALLIDAPGENTTALNKDLFVKRPEHRGARGVMSRAAAAMALYTLQTYAPSGGQGHRTSLRGGGPLTTVVLPPEEERPPPLARTIRLNLPLRSEAAGAVVPERTFPWLAPTRTSQKSGGGPTTPRDADPLQVFFGMPRRIRLVFTANEAGLPCDITGEVDERIVSGFVAEPWGVQYQGEWDHPLTPYYTPGKSNERLPVHPQPAGIGWRDWPALATGGADSAEIVRQFDTRARDIDALEDTPFRLLAFGYDMDNMKARGFVEARMPLFACADEERRRAIEHLARQAVDAAGLVASQLIQAVKRSLVSDPQRTKELRGDFDHWRERFFADMEAPFWNLLGDAHHRRDAAWVNDEEPRRAWLAALARPARRLFDESIEALDLAEQKRAEAVSRARSGLSATLAGRTKSGEGLFAVLGLPSPEPRPKAAKSKGKPKRTPDERGAS